MAMSFKCFCQKFLDDFQVGFYSPLLILARGEKKRVWFYAIFVDYECLKRASDHSWQIWPIALFSMFLILFYFDFAWKCFSWCYIHHLSILYIFVEFIEVICYFISIKCDHMKSYAFICISFILFLIKQFICILFQFHFHTNASICIHSKRVLVIKKFLLTLNLGIRIWSFDLIFLGCYT